MNSLEGISTSQLLDQLPSLARPAQRAVADEFVARVGADGSVTELVLLEALRDSDAQRRWIAAFVLAKSGRLPSDGWVVVVEALGAADSDIRWAAKSLCEEIAPNAPIAVFLVEKFDSCDAVQRRMILYTLRDIGSPREPAYSLAARATTDPDTHVRLAAISLLRMAEPGVTQAWTAIQACLEDPDPRVSRTAAAALSRQSG